MENAITVRHLRKKYKLFAAQGDRFKEAIHPLRRQYHRDFWALDDISFSVPQGQTVGILGRNGSGKSTLLQILAGTMPATSGEVQVQGRVAALLELGAGFDPMLTGRENVLLYGVISGVPAAEMRTRMPEIEAFADIGDFFDQPVRTYSSGMFARLAFSAAIHIDADILIIDEILGVGDARFQEKCADRLRQLRMAGTTAVFVSHSADAILKVCDSAVLLERGHALHVGLTKEVVNSYHELLYAGERRVNSQRPSPIAEASPGALPVEVAAMMSSLVPVGTERAWYNASERRIGDGLAEIQDFLIAADDRFDFVHLAGNERLSIFLKVLYHASVVTPQIGWAINSPEGMTVSGTNTVSRRISLPPAAAGDVCLYKVTIDPRLGAGEFFINLGVGEFVDSAWRFFDSRRAAIHISVRQPEKSSGFVDFPSTCETLIARM